MGALAYCSPLPPTPSGIADFAAAQARDLTKHFEAITLFCPGRPASTEVAGLPVRPLRTLLSSGGWDHVVYHIGNHEPFHGELYDKALRLPGITVLHEFGIHQLVRDHGRPADLVVEMRRAYGSRGESAARRFVEAGVAGDVADYPLFERLVDASRGLVVHNHHAARRILASRPDVAVRTVAPPLHLPEATTIPTAEQARSRLGLPLDATILGAFGYATPAKRLPVALAAFEEVRKVVPTALFLLVGDLSPDPALRDLLGDRPREGVVATGALGEADFLAAMKAVDIAVNLRHPSRGETSASALHLMGLGLPLIVSNGGSLAEIPDGCCVKVGTDFTEERDLLAAMLSLAGDSDLRNRMGANAARHVRRVHDPEESAASFAEAIGELSVLDPPDRQTSVSREPADIPTLRETFVGEAGADLHELGIDETDDEAVSHLASVIRGII